MSCQTNAYFAQGQIQGRKYYKNIPHKDQKAASTLQSRVEAIVRKQIRREFQSLAKKAETIQKQTCKELQLLSKKQEKLKEQAQMKLMSLSRETSQVKKDMSRGLQSIEKMEYRIKELMIRQLKLLSSKGQKLKQQMIKGLSCDRKRRDHNEVKANGNKSRKSIQRLTHAEIENSENSSE